MAYFGDTKKMKAVLRYKGRKILIELKKVSGIGKFTGLMFKSKNTGALLFEFKKGNRAIHSCFCHPFLAIWLLDGKIVDFKLISPFRLSIKPASDFDRLIEIPFNNRYSQIINLFLDEGKI